MPILDDQSLEFLSHSAEQTQRLGVRLGELLPPGAVICLAGDLGAGKTTMAQGIARGWGALDPVTSPSYVLINHYRRADGSQLLHVDAFRIETEAEAEALGLHEHFASEDPVVIEWPERLGDLVPAERLWIGMSWVDDSRRNLLFAAAGAAYAALLKDLRRAAVGR